MNEISKLPDHPRIRRAGKLTAERVQRFLDLLHTLAVHVEAPPRRFSYARDAADARYIDLAIETGAMLVVSNDRDLLDLMEQSNLDGQSLRASYPSFHVLTPPQFLTALRDAQS
ncbi:MAG: putative toxin-antitoxin system toxin component, PIN family [Tepidisphaeraceae bacterium]